jgi:hypothetical protein
MTPEQAHQQRDLALKNAILGLGRLPSQDLGPSSPQASAILLDLQQRIAAIEAAEVTTDRQQQAERARAAGSEEEQIAATMEAMAARGLGRI